MLYVLLCVIVHSTILTSTISPTEPLMYPLKYTAEILYSGYLKEIYELVVVQFEDVFFWLSIQSDPQEIKFY